MHSGVDIWSHSSWRNSGCSSSRPGDLDVFRDLSSFDTSSGDIKTCSILWVICLVPNVGMFPSGSLVYTLLKYCDKILAFILLFLVNGDFLSDGSRWRSPTPTLALLLELIYFQMSFGLSLDCVARFSSYVLRALVVSFFTLFLALL